MVQGRIYERRCDLTPAGDRLVYFAASFRQPLHSWTAISRPPYLTALALWPKGDCSVLMTRDHWREPHCNQLAGLHLMVGAFLDHNELLLVLNPDREHPAPTGQPFATSTLADSIELFSR